MDLLKNLNNMSVPTAEDFKNYSGFIEETDRLIEFAKLHVEAALKYNREHMPQSRVDKYLEENIK